MNTNTWGDFQICISVPLMYTNQIIWAEKFLNFKCLLVFEKMLYLRKE